MFFTFTLSSATRGDDESEWNTSERVVHDAVTGNVGPECLGTDQ